MALTTQIAVKCPHCGAEHDVSLVQSLDAEKDTALKARLLAGQLNQLDCQCGKRTQLATRLLYVDGAKHFTAQVVPGDDEQFEQALSAFQRSGVGGLHRLVPSLNALVEKVKMLEAGFDDWALELTKVLLLAPMGSAALNQVMLFDGVDAERGLRWVLFDEAHQPKTMHSALAPFERARQAWQPFAPSGEPRVDRRWAVETMQRVMAPTG